MPEQRRESQQWCGRDNRHLDNSHQRNRHFRYDDHEHRSICDDYRFYRWAVSNLSAADKDFVMKAARRGVRPRKKEGIAGYRAAGTRFFRRLPTYRPFP